MKKILFNTVLFVFFTACLFAQTLESSGKITIEPLLAAQGFAFQGKDFRTARLALINDAESNNSDQKSQAQQKLSGMLLIGGFEYKLEVVSFEEDSLEADLFCKPENTAGKTAKKDKNQSQLEVPVGHISIKLSQPDPGSLVWLGTLRLTDEKVESVSGTFDLYLNDITPPKGQKPESSKK